MNEYLNDLNLVAEKVIKSKGQHLDRLYAKIIEGKEKRFDFRKEEPSINHIKPGEVSIENKLLYEHYAYLINAINENTVDLQFSTNMEGDIKRALQFLYADQRSDAYFRKSENENFIYYIFTDSVIDFVVDKALNRHLESLLYQQKISASKFINAWISFFKINFPQDEVYDSDIKLTSYILGEKRGDVEIDKIKTPFYHHLQEALGILLKPYREDKFADVSIYSTKEFSDVFSLQYKREEREDILKHEHKNWFKDCLITLEHENKYLNSFTEMMYLTYRRARLKVLVTYYDKDTQENTRNIFGALCENFSNIIRQSNLLFNENEQTEYLLIVGSKLEKERSGERKFIWNMQAFNWSGQWTEKYSQL